MPGEKGAEATGRGELTLGDLEVPPPKDQPTEEGDATHTDLLSAQLEFPAAWQDGNQTAKEGGDPVGREKRLRSPSTSTKRREDNLAGGMEVPSV